MNEEKRRDSTSSSAKMSLLLFSLNEKAINWKRDNLENKGMTSLFLIVLPFLFPLIPYCHQDYTKRSLLVYTITGVLCTCVYVCTHKGSFPALSLIDVTSPLSGWKALMYIMLQFVCVRQSMSVRTRILNTYMHGHMCWDRVLVNKTVLA